MSAEAHRTADRTQDDPDPPDADAPHWLRLSELSREAVSPLTRVEHVLLPWSSFLVVPVFAFANAGVDLSGTSLAAAAGSAIVWAIVVARVIGKLVGIWGGTLFAARVGLVDLPASLRSNELAAMAAAAGAGFTVSLFVAEVSFGPRSPLLEPVKIALLLASITSALICVALRSRSR